MMKRVNWIAVVLLTGIPVNADEVSVHARRAVETINQLRAIGLGSQDSEKFGPPPRVPGLLRTLNQELEALIAEGLRDRQHRSLLSQEDILDQLRAAGWEEIASHKWNAYGEIRRINLDWKPRYDPALLVVSTELWIPCGNADPDSAIYVFRAAGHSWELVLATESDFDPMSQDPQSGLQYIISPQDDEGRWFLLVGHAPPLCTGRGNAFKYKVLRPGCDPENPVVIAAGRETVDRFYDPPFNLQAETDWFSLTEGKTRRLDDEPGVAILRYQVEGNRAQRIHPLALSPEDFLDQWAQLSWEEARKWSTGSAGIESWHSKISHIAPGSVEIESVHRCSGSEDGDQKWLLELSVDEQPDPALGLGSLFVKIDKTNGIFSVAGIQPSHPAGCNGRTPITAIKGSSALPVW
jgi:hypothetical protein